MATIDESDFTNKQVDVKDHFAALQRTMIDIQKIDTETISSQLSSLADVMGESLSALADGKLKDKDHQDLQKYLDKLGLMAEESANVIKSFNAYKKEVANSKDEEEALGKMIDANQASMKKINALEAEREELINKVNNHNSITEELSNKINNVLERREQYQETSNNLVQKYNDKIEKAEQKLKAENLSQQDIAKLQQEKINLETKIGDVKDRTNRFLENSLSLHEDLKTKLQEQQQLYEDAPNRIESINSKLRSQISFNDIIKKDLEQFSDGMEDFGLMTDKSRKAVEKVLGIDKGINKELKKSIDNQDKLTGKIDKTHQNSKNVLQTLENSVERTELLISDTTDFANEMGRAADEAERLLAAMSAMQFPEKSNRRRRRDGAEPNPFSINDSGQAVMPTPGGYTTTVSAGFAAAATAGMTAQAKNSGGYISGPDGIDVIPAMLTNGEYVVNASATKKFLPLLEKINSGQSQSFASGGMVGNNPWTSAKNSKPEKHLEDIERHLKEQLGITKEEASKSQKDVINQGLFGKMLRNIQQSKDQIIGHQTKQGTWDGREAGSFALPDEDSGKYGLKSSYTKSHPTGMAQLEDLEWHAVSDKHFLKGPGDIYKDLQQETIKVHMENLRDNGTDFSKVDEKTIKADIAKQVQINLKAFETLYKGIEKENEVTNKIQGYQLAQGEAAGASPERKSDLADALKQQADSMEFLKNAGVIGDDFGQRVEDTKRDQLVNSVFFHGLRDQLTTAIKEGLYNDTSDIRKMLGQYKSQAELTELAQSGSTDMRNAAWSSRQTPAYFKALDRLTGNKNRTPDFTDVSANQERQKGKNPISLGTHIIQQIEKSRVKEDAVKPGKPGGSKISAGGVNNSKKQSDWMQTYNKSNDITLAAITKSNDKIFDMEVASVKFGVSRYAELNSQQQEFWDSSSDAVNQAHKEIQKAVLGVAAAGEEGKRKLEQLAMQTTQTFSLIGNDLPTNLLNVRDATIDTLNSLKDATKGGSLLGMDLGSEIDKLKELQLDQTQNRDSIASSFESLTSMSNSGMLDKMASENKVERSTAISGIYDMIANQLNGTQMETGRLTKRIGISNAEGKINGLSTGGFVSGPMGKDVIPAMLTNGEYVIRADVAKNWRGFLEHLNSNGHLGLHRGGPVMLADGGSPGGGSGGGGGGGGGGGSGPDLSAMLSQLSKNNAEVQSMSIIFSEIVESVKKYNEEGKTAEQIQALINTKVSDMQEMLESELELQHKLSIKTDKRLGQLQAIEKFKLAGVHDAVLGTFTAVEEKIEGIIGSIPFVGSTLAMSIKASTGPAFDELRDGASNAFLDMADEFNNNGMDLDGAINTGMETFKKSASKAGEHMQMISSFAKKIGPGMIAAGAAALGFVALLGLGLKRFFELEEQQEEFRKGLGLMASTAKPIENMARNAQQEFARAGVTLEQAFNAATSLTSELGTTHLVSQEAVKTISLMEAGLGLSADTAAGAYDMFKLMGSSSGESAENMMMATSALADAAGVPLDQVMQDIAGASEDTQKFMKGNAKQMMIAAVQARRLGVSMDTITGAMSQALDIESSISEEMRLASMLGKHINLNAMRRASFEGDAEKVMQEQLKALKNMGGTDAMNPYQLEQAAKALGLSVGEMIKMEKHEKGLQALKNGTAAQQKMASEYEAMQNKLKKEGVKSAAEEAEERIKAQQAELVKANIMAEVNNLMTKLGEVLLPMIEGAFKLIMPVLNAIFWVLGMIVDVIGFILTPLNLVGDIIKAIDGDADALKARFDGIVPTLITISGVIAGIGALFLGLGPMIGKLFSGMVTGAKKAFGFIQNGVKGAFGKLTGGGGDASGGGGVTDKIKGMFGGDKAKSGDLVPDVNTKKSDKFKKFLKGFNKINMKQVLKGAAAMLILSGALFVTAKAFQAFSKVSWGGVAKGIVGLTALVVTTKFIEKGSKKMIKGAIAIAFLGAALLPAAYAFGMFGDVDWLSVAFAGIALAGLAAGALILGAIASSPPFWIGIGAIAALGAALIPFAFALKLAAPALEVFGKVILGIAAVIGGIFKTMVDGIKAFGAIIIGVLAGFANIFETVGSAIVNIINAISDGISSFVGSIISLSNIDGSNLYIVAGGLVALAGGFTAMSVALAAGGLLSLFSSDDPFGIYIQLGQNAPLLNEAAVGLRNIASSLCMLSDIDAEDILEDIADGMEELFDEIEDIEPKSINKFVSIGTSFGLIGEGMKELKTGISPFKEMLTLISDPSNYESAVVGINALTLALTDLCSVIQSLGESELGVLEVASADSGGVSTSTQEMASSGAGAIPMTDVVQQVASVPAAPGVAMNSADGASNKGVEKRLDELISLMKSGKIGVNLDGKKVEKQLAKAAP
jgi:hypothetical protein